MSRYSKRLPDGRIVEYGFDPVPTPGYFYDIFEAGDDIPVEGGDTRSSCVIPPQEHMDRSEITVRLKELNVPTNHIAKIQRGSRF